MLEWWSIGCKKRAKKVNEIRKRMRVANVDEWKRSCCWLVNVCKGDFFTNVSHYEFQIKK